MRLFFLTLCMTALAAISLSSSHAETVTSDAPAQSESLAHRTLIVDTHIDVPYRLVERWADVSQATSEGDFDYPRAVAGGLDVAFMSIFTPAELPSGISHYQLANQLIDHVEAMAARAPEKFVLVDSVADTKGLAGTDKVGLALGMENGSPIRTLEDARWFYDRGVRYTTLAHSASNHISDSSYDTARPNKGLSEFGKQLVARMNQLGMMVDVSHLSDLAVADVLKVSTAPVIASHSSARRFTPGFERNLSDELIVALAGAGGVIQVNFGSSFLTEPANEWYTTFAAARTAFMEAQDVTRDSEAVEVWSTEYREANPLPFATLDQVLDHFDHIVAITGIDHVGIGSDYDGVGDSLPAGLKDVSSYPNLVDGLRKRGYDDAAISRILGGNLIRVWKQVEAESQQNG